MMKIAVEIYQDENTGLYDVEVLDTNEIHVSALEHSFTTLDQAVCFVIELHQTGSYEITYLDDGKEYTLQLKAPKGWDVVGELPADPWANCDPSTEVISMGSAVYEIESPINKFKVVRVISDDITKED